MEVLSFMIVTTLLFAEGMMLGSTFFSLRKERLLVGSIAYPLGAMLNTALYYLLFLMGISFTPLSLTVGHILLLIILTTLTLRCHKTSTEMPPRKTNSFPQSIDVLYLLLIAATLIASLYYVLSMPTFYWDTFTNWNMRAKHLYATGTLFAEHMIHMEYPVLLHSLQASYMQLPGWNDTLANLSTFLLSLCSLSSLFCLTNRQYGRSVALFSLWLITSVPLITLHLRQGYADIHVAFSILLAAVLLHAYRENEETPLLILSTLFVVAAAWTKLEGLYFGVCIWILLVILRMLSTRSPQPFLPWGLLILLSLFWPILLWSRGLSASPHTVQFQWHLGEIPRAFEALFLKGTFGMHWYAILVALLVSVSQKTWKTLLHHIVFQWAIVSLGLLFIIYFLTSEAIWLLNGKTFSRTMLIPTVLLLWSLCVHLGTYDSDGET